MCVCVSLSVVGYFGKSNVHNRENILCHDNDDDDDDGDDDDDKT